MFYSQKLNNNRKNNKVQTIKKMFDSTKYYDIRVNDWLASLEKKGYYIKNVKEIDKGNNILVVVSCVYYPKRKSLLRNLTNYSSDFGGRMYRKAYNYLFRY